MGRQYTDAHSIGSGGEVQRKRLNLIVLTKSNTFQG